jgi:hypothetical protein
LTRYDPERAAAGYNLVLYKSRVPALIGMDGEIVHAWPDIKAAERIRLTREGHLLVIGVDNGIREFDWDGRLLWEFFNEEREDFPHHDLIRLRNGHILAVFRDKRTGTDYIDEITRGGKIAWEWRAAEYLEKYFQGKITEPKDKTHINSMQELPPNHWYEEGHPEFRPGNILVSARNLNTIFIIEKGTKEVVWQYDRELDHQHEALMIERGYHGEGNILLFNNGLENLYHFRTTIVMEIDPVGKSTVWQYRSPYFFSSDGGVAQCLPNGNVLIASQRGGRMFEVDPNGEILWQWLPPFPPIRPHRYSPDFCPQFEGLGRPSLRPISTLRGSLYVDRQLYQVADKTELISKEIKGRMRALLKARSLKRPLVIPDLATLHVSCGLDGDRIRSKGISRYSARFVVSLRPEGDRGEVVLMNRQVGLADDSLWIERTFPLDDYAFLRVVLSLDVRDDARQDVGGRIDSACGRSLSSKETRMTMKITCWIC